MSKNRFPPGWDEKRVKSVIAHYESQPEDGAVAEGKAAMGGTVMAVPAELIPEVRELIAKHKKRAWRATSNRAIQRSASVGTTLAGTGPGADKFRSASGAPTARHR